MGVVSLGLVEEVADEVLVNVQGHSLVASVQPSLLLLRFELCLEIGKDLNHLLHLEVVLILFGNFAETTHPPLNLEGEKVKCQLFLVFDCEVGLGKEIQKGLPVRLIISLCLLVQFVLKQQVGAVLLLLLSDRRWWLLCFSLNEGIPFSQL